MLANLWYVDSRGGESDSDSDRNHLDKEIEEILEQFHREGVEARAEKQLIADLVASLTESARALRDAQHAEPQPPCEQYQCANTRNCAVNRLLCGSFYRYATEHDSPVEPPTKPTASYYRRLYGRK